MKSWEPEKVFKKPDFPVVRRDGEQSGPAAKKEPPKKPAVPPPQAGRQEKVRGEVIPRDAAGQVEAWTPGLDLNAPKKPATPSGTPLAGDSWVPDLEFTRADFPRPAQKNGTPVKREATGSAARPPSGPAAGASLGETILKETVLADPNRAVDQLRNWFWAKPGLAGDNPALAQVKPHERVFIVLASLGKEITEYLFTLLSPAERIRFQEILKQSYQPQAGHVQLVRRAFAEAIRGDAR